MKTPKMKFAMSQETVSKAITELTDLYSWLAESPTGVEADLHGLSVAMEILEKIVREGKDA